MITPNWKPDARQLRVFALLWLLAFTVLGLRHAWQVGALAGSIPLGWHDPWRAAIVLWSLAAMGVFGILKPALARPVYSAWMTLAFPIGWAISLVLLAVTFFVLFTACGVGLRLVCRRSFARRFDRSATTYWVQRRPVTDVASYFHQY